MEEVVAAVDPNVSVEIPPGQAVPAQLGASRSVLHPGFGNKPLYRKGSAHPVILAADLGSILQEESLTGGLHRWVIHVSIYPCQDRGIYTRYWHGLNGVSPRGRFNLIDTRWAYIFEQTGDYISIPLTQDQAEADRIALKRYFAEHEQTFLSTLQRPSKKKAYEASVDNRKVFGNYPEVTVFLTMAVRYDSSINILKLVADPDCRNRLESRQFEEKPSEVRADDLKAMIIPVLPTLIRRTTGGGNNSLHAIFGTTTNDAWVNFEGAALLRTHITIWLLGTPFDEMSRGLQSLLAPILLLEKPSLCKGLVLATPKTGKRDDPPIEAWMYDKTVWTRYCTLFAEQSRNLKPAELRIVSFLTRTPITVDCPNGEKLHFSGNDLMEMKDSALMKDTMRSVIGGSHFPALKEVRVMYDGIGHYEQVAQVK